MLAPGGLVGHLDSTHINSSGRPALRAEVAEEI